MNAAIRMTAAMSVMGCLVTLTASAAATAVWDTANNTVTYSYNEAAVGTLTANGAAVSLDFLKFSSANAVAAGEAAGTYSLSKVILSVDGTVAGTFTFQNDTTGNATIHSASLSSGFTFTVGGLTAQESFNAAVAGPQKVAGHSTFTQGFSSSGNGPITTVTQALDQLAAFSDTGSGNNYYTSIMELSAAILGEYSNKLTASVPATGSGSISVTYEYVPEPTALSLICLGSAFLALRRRHAAKASVPRE